MIIGTAKILLGVFVIVIAYVTYTLVKQLRTLPKSQAWCIFDLMVIGVIPAGYLYAKNAGRPNNNTENSRLVDIPIWIWDSAT